jgi:hypothetical protein
MFITSIKNYHMTIFQVKDQKTEFQTRTNLRVEIEEIKLQLKV